MNKIKVDKNTKLSSLLRKLRFMEFFSKKMIIIPKIVVKNKKNKTNQVLVFK